MAEKIMDEFFTATFEGGRHQKRVDKIAIKWGLPSSKAQNTVF
jgi:ribose 5-phosphate isomerase RpiB